jgi:hypothetical protein
VTLACGPDGLEPATSSSRQKKFNRKETEGGIRKNGVKSLCDVEITGIFKPLSLYPGPYIFSKGEYFGDGAGIIFFKLEGKISKFIDKYEGA